MRGYGLTVFRGETPTRFDVEVIDVLTNFRPDMDLILVRTEHPILERATTVAGMSGSPIYLDGRLAGAYAYGWPFGKEPVAGVTPIASMMAEIDRPVRSDSFFGSDFFAPAKRARPLTARRDRDHNRRRSRHADLIGPYLGREHRTAFDPIRDHVERLGLPRESNVNDDTQVAAASTPLLLGGFSERVAEMLGSELAPFGLVTLQAGGGARRRRNQQAQPAPGPAFVDGGAIGVQLVRGDVSATAVGTVTHVNGDRLVAFGHPMMNAGEIGLPTSTARVLHILASENRSFKIAEAADPLGTLVHDRQSTIVIDTRQNGHVVPLTFRVHGVDGAPRTEWNVEVANHRLMTPLLSLSALVNAMEATASDQNEAKFRAVSRLEIAGHGTLELEDHGFMPAGPSGPGSLARIRLFDLMEAAYGNPFEVSRIVRGTIDLYVTFGRENLLEIIDASIAQEEVDPGGRLNVHVLLRRYGEADQVRVVPVDIPDYLAGETIELKVQPADEVIIERPEARTLDDIIGVIRDRHPATSLAISIQTPSRGMQFRGHVVRSLPGSALDTLQLVNDSSANRPFVTNLRQLVAMGDVLNGSATLRVTVRRTPRD